jgi:hypothetical protein
VLVPVVPTPVVVESVVLVPVVPTPVVVESVVLVPVVLTPVGLVVLVSVAVVSVTTLIFVATEELSIVASTCVPVWRLSRFKSAGLTVITWVLPSAVSIVTELPVTLLIVPLTV